MHEDTERPNIPRLLCKNSTRASLHSYVTGRPTCRQNYKLTLVHNIYNLHHQLFYYSMCPGFDRSGDFADLTKACIITRALYMHIVLGCRNTYSNHSLRAGQGIDTLERCASNQQLPFPRSSPSMRANTDFATSTTAQFTLPHLLHISFCLQTCAHYLNVKARASEHV